VTLAVRERGYSQRRACGLVGLHPKTYRYAAKRSGDEELRIRLRELASQRRRFGYRRLGLMLKRQGIKLTRKKLYRLYKEERLTVRKRGGRKRALGIPTGCLLGLNLRLNPSPSASRKRNSPKIALRPETVSAETETQAQEPANCGLLGRLQEICRFERLRGGPGRTRTSNQIIINRRLWRGLPTPACPRK
jgi:hypothetical protein